MQPESGMQSLQGGCQKIEVSNNFKKIFESTLGHALQHTRTPKALDKPPRLQSTRSLTQSLTFDYHYKQKPWIWYQNWSLKSNFLKKCVFSFIDPLRSKNRCCGIRMNCWGCFEVFLKLENIFYRYFEHKIEKN